MLPDHEDRVPGKAGIPAEGRPDKGSLPDLLHSTHGIQDP